MKRAWGLLLLVPLLMAAMPERREVIVLYNSAERVGLRGEGSPTAVELVLNHLGLIARFRDLSKGLPDAGLSQRARGVISLAEGDSAPGAAALTSWLKARHAAGQRVLLLGGLPFLTDARTHEPTPPATWRPLLDSLGLHYGGDFLGDPAQLSLAFAAPAARFEVPWTSAEVPPYVAARCRLPAHPWLRVRRKDTGETADIAVVGPAGAVVLGRECLFDVNPLSYRVRWRVDPFALIGAALGTEGEPRPDPTTLEGRRVFYAHVDGDGFTNLALARGQPYAAEVLRDKLFSQTPLPTTVSVIARDIVGNARASAVARSIFKLPNVEAGTHTYNHPHDFERGTLTPIGQVADGDRLTGIQPTHKLSPTREIDDSIKAIDALLPPGHHVGLVQWSGSTNPTAPFLARCLALGVPNLNGGDAMIDPVHPSVANVAPFARQVGPYVQVYASAANENLFTNLWNGPFDGQREVLDTFKFGGAPRRLAAVDIYYHFYSGERPASLQALRELYGWAAAQPFIYLHASHYARLVEGFYSARLTRLGPASWQADGLGACRTLRFDHEPRNPDLGACVGVEGYNRANGSLYVHLAGSAARVVLGTRSASKPYLVSASAPLDHWQAAATAVTAHVAAAAPCEVELAGLPPGQAVTVSDGWKATRGADSQGHLLLHAGPGARALAVKW